MSNSLNEKPFFVLRGTLRTLFAIETLVFVVIFLLIISNLGTNYNALVLIGIIFSLLIAIWIAMYHTGSKGKLEFYSDRFRMLDGEKLVKEIYYSDLRIDEQLVPPYGRRPVLFEHSNGELVFTIPRTGRKKELDQLSLSDWLKTKVPPRTKN